MAQLFSKDEELDLSPPIVAWKIMEAIGGRTPQNLSIFDLAEALKKKGVLSAKSLQLGLVFLFLIGKIEVRDVYVHKVDEDAIEAAV